MPSAVTPERFAQGMTFDEYVAYIGTPQNLQRESGTAPRQDISASFRNAFEQARLRAVRPEAIWLARERAELLEGAGRDAEVVYTLRSGAVSHPKTGETMVYLAMIRLMLARLGRV